METHHPHPHVTATRIPFVLTAPGRPAHVAKDEGAARHTNLFVTINTNLGPRDNAHAQVLASALERCMGYLTVPSGLDNVFDFTAPGISFADTDPIHSAHSVYAVERGGGKNSIHAHWVVKIQHSTRLRINMLKLKQYVQFIMGTDVLPKFPNVKVRLLANPNEDADLLHYLTKTQSQPSVEQGSSDSD